MCHQNNIGKTNILKGRLMGGGGRRSSTVVRTSEERTGLRILLLLPRRFGNLFLSSVLSALYIIYHPSICSDGHEPVILSCLSFCRILANTPKDDNHTSFSVEY